MKYRYVPDTKSMREQTKGEHWNISEARVVIKIQKGIPVMLGTQNQYMYPKKTKEISMLRYVILAFKD